MTDRLVSLSIEDDLLTIACEACGAQACVELVSVEFAPGRSTPDLAHVEGCPVLALGRALDAGDRDEAARILADALALAEAGRKPQA